MKWIDEIVEEKIKEVITRHYSEILSELEEDINTDFLEIQISGKYEDMLGGFDFKL